MAISRVRAKLNGTWSNLTKNASTGKWSASLTAPAATSYNQTGRYYPITVEVTNDAGTVKLYETTDTQFGATLKLVVKEKTKPVITLVSPSAGAHVANNKQPVTFKVTDETGGSGVNLSEVKLKVDSTTIAYNGTGMSHTAITNGYQFVYTPSAALADGSHTITINAKDNDGNAATAVSSTMIIDTTPPTLAITAPNNNLKTNNPALTVRGTTNDATSSPVIVTVKLNSGAAVAVTVGSDGTFSKALTLTEGINTITVVAKDGVGKTTTVTRTVALDTSIPAVTSIVLSKNPASVSESITITVEVE